MTFPFSGGGQTFRPSNFVLDKGGVVLAGLRDQGSRAGEGAWPTGRGRRLGEALLLLRLRNYPKIRLHGFEIAVLLAGVFV